MFHNIDSRRLSGSRTIALLLPLPLPGSTCSKLARISSRMHLESFTRTAAGRGSMRTTSNLTRCSLTTATSRPSTMDVWTNPGFDASRCPSIFSSSLTTRNTKLKCFFSFHVILVSLLFVSQVRAYSSGTQYSALLKG
jgi:hypothetical protein